MSVYELFETIERYGLVVVQGRFLGQLMRYVLSLLRPKPKTDSQAAPKYWADEYNK